MNMYIGIPQVSKDEEIQILKDEVQRLHGRIRFYKRIVEIYNSDKKADAQRTASIHDWFPVYS